MRKMKSDRYERNLRIVNAGNRGHRDAAGRRRATGSHPGLQPGGSGDLYPSEPGFSPARIDTGRLGLKPRRILSDLLGAVQKGLKEANRPPVRVTASPAIYCGVTGQQNNFRARFRPCEALHPWQPKQKPLKRFAWGMRSVVPRNELRGWRPPYTQVSFAGPFGTAPDCLNPQGSTFLLGPAGHFLCVFDL